MNQHPQQEEQKSALEQFGIDLTAVARSGKLDPVIGRDAEIRRVSQVLSRRTKNNPVLIGIREYLDVSILRLLQFRCVQR